MGSARATVAATSLAVLGRTSEVRPGRILSERMFSASWAARPVRTSKVPRRTAER